ncbi:hypothetical protein [Rhizobium sp. CCGE 510]|uniref:hypothetical protein n=1 Tax=Rhizobium sp. CCGE 510 TaxID=1132836 RepID=UPI00027B834A|nr:hypothetical protein [Rhizobium sp. CCGE 510]EJT06784.1 hypothetical protein RCCGE510_03283 [Rhizobium sp. CCGE 510]
MGPAHLHLPGMADLEPRFGWGGKDKPYSIRFGFICGSGMALVLLATVYIQRYAGLGLSLALLYLGVRTKFFERWN